MKKAYKIDIPVALVFFNRPAQFKKVFETVRQAAPSKLFLIQDGARAGNENDANNIGKCREILNEIDWECEVHQDFSEENLGCGKRVYSGLSRCFEKVDRLIILEDDCVPSQSFFPFCKEILEKYKDDERIGMISGMNHLNTFDKVDGDYFFSLVGSIAGWATWKRSWSLANYDLSAVSNDATTMRLLRQHELFAPTRNRVYSDVIRKTQLISKGQKLTSWSTQFGISQILHSKLIVIPKVNLMSNIGLTEESANSVSDIKYIPRGLRPLYSLKLYNIEFPLKEPKYVVNDIEYCHRVDDMMRPGKLVSLGRKIESIWLRLTRGDAKNLFKKLFRKLRQIT